MKLGDERSKALDYVVGSLKYYYKDNNRLDDIHTCTTGYTSYHIAGMYTDGDASVCLCNHSTLYDSQPSMTQGQGEGKVKLHTMNLVAAGSPITDMGCV